MAEQDTFDDISAPARNPANDDDGFLVVDLPSYEGPLDLLVDMARARKVDLNLISVLEIADQFLTWLRNAKGLELEAAADWLAMAATLALLKSKLLIPVPNEERTAAVAAFEDLALRLKRLNAVRDVAEELLNRRRLGEHWFRPVQSDTIRGQAKRLDANLHALLLAYADEARVAFTPKEAPVRQPFQVMSVEDAIEFLQKNGILGPAWVELPDVVNTRGAKRSSIYDRSRIATSYVGALELAKRGEIELAQVEGEGRSMVKVRRP